MKKSLLFFVFALLVLPLIAQDYSDMYVQFMGIPVDGTKSEMISKLRGKGFSYNRNTDELSGRFNGRNVILKVVENNGKVYRVMVADEYYSNETDIIIYYNILIEQFENNEKYKSYSDNNRIKDGENIHYEMSVNNKRYEAVFFQKYDMEESIISLDTTLTYIDDDAFLDSIHNSTMRFLRDNFGGDAYQSYLQDIQGKTKEEIFDYDKGVLKVSLLALQAGVEMRRVVWFMINEDEQHYRKYKILLFYDNGFNEPNGEDL